MANKEDLHKIAEEAAQKAVDNTFERLGFSIDDPHKMQRLMVKIEELVDNESLSALCNSGLNRQDFEDLKNMLDDYRNSEDIRHSTKKGVTGWLVKGGIGLALAGLGAWIGSFFQGGGGFPHP